MKIRLFMTGRAYHHASALPAELELPDGATMREALDAVAAILPNGVQLASSSLIALGGEHVGSVGKFANRPLHAGEELTIIAPVAGG